MFFLWIDGTGPKTKKDCLVCITKTKGQWALEFRAKIVCMCDFVFKEAYESTELYSERCVC